MAGIVFAVALLGFVIVTLSIPDLKGADGPVRVTRFYADSGHRAMLIIGSYLAAVAAVAFIAFANGLRRSLATSRVNAAELLSGASRLAASAIGVGGACYGAAAAYLAFGLAPQIDPQLGAIIPSVGHSAVFVVGLLSAGVVVLTACSGGQKSTMPSWLRTLGYAAAVGCLAGIFIVPVLLFVVWVIAASTWLVRSAR